MLPALYKHHNVCWTAFVDITNKSTSQYDMIIGRDLLDKLGINFLLSQNLMEWDGATTPMIDPDRLGSDSIDYLEMEIFYIGDPLTTETEQIQKILDAKYCKADLKQIAQECDQLDQQQKKLLKLLQKYEQLFDGTDGTWKTAPVDLQLKDPTAAPYHA